MIVTRKEAVDLIKDSMDTDISLQGENFEKVVLAINEDLQVRDWMMGMPERYPIKDCVEWTQYMAVKTTREDSVPFIAVQAILQYEQDNVEQQIALLNYAHSINPEYSLVTLLRRVCDIGFPAEYFTTMRKEIDSKIIEECEGKNGSTIIESVSVSA
jgi:hypothetical protein